MADGWRGEGAQHAGARPYQEDSWRLGRRSDGTLIAALADGMGGHAGGAVASRLAVEAFLAAATADPSLEPALEAANRAIGDGVRADAKFAGMGCTLVGVLLAGDRVDWISVGDSPLWCLEAGDLARLNADHSMAPQLAAMVERGMMTREEAEEHPAHHRLRDAVMGEELQLIDRGTRALGPGARLLLCSDGVQTLPESRLAELARSPVQALVDAVIARARPGQDNVTALLLERDT